MIKLINNKYMIAFFLSIVIYVIYLIMMKIYPFGEYSILKCDLYQQYVNFFCYLKEILVHGKSVFISWNLGLCNTFFTTFAYYLISPLNLGVIFFNSSNMDIFIEIITYIKISLAVIFAILYFEKVYKYKDLEVVLFGLIYGYSSYVICYSFHIMWLDCIYMLPLILLFVDLIIEKGKILPLTIAMSYSILANYYMGYILCLFTGIYFLARLIIVKKKDAFKCIFRFGISMLIAVGIGMIVIIPSMQQLSGNMNFDTKLLDINFNKIKLFINVIFNNYVYMFTQKSCFMFSSTLTILLVPLYYLNEKIEKREKIVFTLIVIFLLLPIISPLMNKLWHAFTIPNCFNYRYSFTLIFITIIMAFREYQNKEFTKKSHFIVSFLVFTILTLIEIVLNQKGYLESDNYTVSNKSIILSCIIYLAMFVITYLIFFADKKLYWKYALFVVVIVDLMIGARSGQNNNDKYFKREVFTQYDTAMEHIMQKIEVPETDRIVFIPDSYGSNMSLKYGYSNIGFFTSARNREMLKSMYRWGYNVQRDEELWITSYSGTFLNYSIAGVKYYITREELDDDIYGFSLVDKYEDFYIYENANKFNIGFYLKDNVEESYNPFKMQNDLLNNLKDSSEADDRNYFESIEDSRVLKCDKNVRFDDDTSEYTIKYKVKALSDCTIYLQSDYNLQLFIDGSPMFEDYSNIWSYETGIKQIKHLDEGESFEFVIKTKQNLDLLFVYVSDNLAISDVINNMNNSNYIYDTQIMSNGLTGKVNFEDDGFLVFSINYDKNWKAYVDGEEAEVTPIGGAFVGVWMEKGEHKISLTIL